jgi:hypothetical protein
MYVSRVYLGDSLLNFQVYTSRQRAGRNWEVVGKLGRARLRATADQPRFDMTYGIPRKWSLPIIKKLAPDALDLNEKTFYKDPNAVTFTNS